MHLHEIRIRNVRSIRQLEWKLPAERKAAGWHVILGDNGSGKSSFLRSVALGLIGPRDAASLRLSWDDWLRKGAEDGTIDLELTFNPVLDQFSGKGKTPRDSSLSLRSAFERQRASPRGVVFEQHGTDKTPLRTAWGDGGGWFCAAYGPFRRFTGGDENSRYIALKLPKLSRFISIFDEKVALGETLEWLRSLKLKSLEIAERSSRSNHADEADLLPGVIRFINQEGFLPHQAKLIEITSEAVQFVDGNGLGVSMLELSDGYRSILSMTFELLRQLAAVFGAERLFDPNDPTRVIPEGVVLIDEVDVHLHPTWQRRVGYWFRRHFPNVQFLVTTHSPLVCPAVGEDGSIFLLPRPGTDEPGRMLEGVELRRLIDGNVLDAYGTEAFGRDVERSEVSRSKLERLAELNVASRARSLTAAEKEEQRDLRAAMPTSSGVSSLDDDSAS